MLTLRFLNLYQCAIQDRLNHFKPPQRQAHSPPQIYPRRRQQTSTSIVQSSKYSTLTNSDQCRCQLFWFEEIYVNVIPRLLLQNLLLSRPLLNLIHLTVQSLVLSKFERASML